MVPHKGFSAAALSLDASTFYSSHLRIVVISNYFTSIAFTIFLSTLFGGDVVFGNSNWLDTVAPI
jgi:hypothetical protein